MDRLVVLKDLIAFNKSAAALADDLSRFDWDYEGQPLVVSALQVEGVLRRFMAGERSAKELEDWANLIECREDLEFEESKRDLIENVIHRIANPVLEGEITPALCEMLLGMLARS